MYYFMQTLIHLELKNMFSLRMLFSCVILTACLTVVCGDGVQDALAQMEAKLEAKFEAKIHSLEARYFFSCQYGNTINLRN